MIKIRLSGFYDLKAKRRDFYGKRYFSFYRKITFA